MPCESFMQAVADSNLVKMANLWGTASGPAAKTNQPPDYQRRIAIMQAYLRNDSFRVTVGRPGTDQNRRACRSRSSASSCTWAVPFTHQDPRRSLDRHPARSGCGREPGAPLRTVPEDSAPQG